MFPQSSTLEHTALTYLPEIKKSTYSIYVAICLMFIIAIASLPFLYTDISIKSQGIIRPNYERTEIRSLIPGILDTVYVKEGQFVEKGSMLALLKDNITSPKKILNAYEILQHQQYIHDLSILTSSPSITNSMFIALQSPVYKQQISQFVYRKADQEAAIKKVNNEIQIDSLLRAEKIISTKEMFDKNIESERLNSNYQAFKNQQYGIWEQDLAKYKLELSQLLTQAKQIHSDKKQFEIRAPIAGVVQGINAKYEGGVLQANESLCIISPNTELIAECYVSTQNIGLLKLGQVSKFQIDAFDYNYFGILTGKIIDIDDDFTMINDNPVFKIHCTFDNKQLFLKNGFEGKLKKGLTLQSRFVVANRSLWQLLFDNIDDWLNPSSPRKITENLEQKNQN